jgi:hypothetical protein
VGAEATCRVTVAGTTGDAHALLETDDVIIRGSAALRCRIPRASITAVTASNGTLTIRHAAGTTTLDLGAKAEAWAHAILHPTLLLDKLGVATGATVSIFGIKDQEFLAALAERTSDVSVGRLRAGSTVIVLAIERERDLPRIASLAPKLTLGVALWAIHRKGPTGIKDTAIFAAARAAGLTYTKVARFSATHTAEKLVVSKRANW